MNSEVVFVGYGVVAPEYGWDDYKGMDIRNKTFIMLVNDPAVPDPKDPSKLDPAFFKGGAMTSYGRWTYKYEIASEKGAAAVILVHETKPAGNPFEVVKGSWSRRTSTSPSLMPDGEAPGSAHRCTWSQPRGDRGMDHLRQGQGAVEASGRDLETLKKAATRRDFRPEPLSCQAQFAITDTLREVHRAMWSPSWKGRSLTQGRNGRLHGTLEPSGPTRRSQVTRSTTEPSTTRRASPRCSRSPGAHLGFSQPPNDRSYS